MTTLGGTVVNLTKGALTPDRLMRTVCDSSKIRIHNGSGSTATVDSSTAGFWTQYLFAGATVNCGALAASTWIDVVDITGASGILANVISPVFDAVGSSLAHHFRVTIDGVEYLVSAEVAQNRRLFVGDLQAYATAGFNTGATMNAHRGADLGQLYQSSAGLAAAAINDIQSSTIPARILPPAAVLHRGNYVEFSESLKVEYQHTGVGGAIYNFANSREAGVQYALD